MFFDDLIVNHEIFRDVHVDIENRIHGKERLCVHDTAIRRIVESPFKPLRRRSDRAVQRKRYHISCERTDSFAAHGISLISHGGRTYLIFFERLFDFLHILQNTDIV